MLEIKQVYITYLWDLVRVYVATGWAIITARHDQPNQKEVLRLQLIFDFFNLLELFF